MLNAQTKSVCPAGAAGNKQPSDEGGKIQMEDMALIEKRRKKEREAWWKKILAYYMLQQIAEQQRRAELIQAYALNHLLITTEKIVIKEGLLARLFRKEPGRMSALEILEKMAPDEMTNSPFRSLLGKIRQQPMSEEETEKAIAEVIEKAPPMIIEDARQETERKQAWQQQQEQERLNRPAEARPEMPKEDKVGIRYESHLRLQLAFMKKLMHPELFDELIQGLARVGRQVDPNELDIPDAQPEQVTYASYIAAKQTQLKMHDGVFVNPDNVYTSAAYMLAAYEQKDVPRFDAARADERAREIFGSKAFRVYLDSHPGSLVAASQNMFLDITHEGMMRLDAELNKRDRILQEVSRNMRKDAPGQTAGYYQALNKLERFARLPVEPSEAERKSLITSLGDYILKDCAPDSPVASENGLKDAMCAVKVLVPAESFKKLLDKVNEGRAQKFAEKDFEKPREIANAGPERANAMDEAALAMYMG